MDRSSTTSAYRTPFLGVLGILGILGIILATTGCDALFPDEDADAIDRSTFIETQVQLRLAAADAEPDQLSQAQRDSILDEQGVTDEHLAAFLAVHGSDEEFMAEVWADVDRKVLETGGLEPEEDPDRIDPDRDPAESVPPSD